MTATPEVPDLDPRVERTHRDVAEAAVKVLIEEGFDALTHMRVAEVAGYSRNTLYRHFPGRTDLLRLAGGFDDPNVHSVPSGETRADLIAELQAFRDALGGDLGPLMASLIERSEHDSSVAHMRSELSGVGSAQMMGTIRTAIERGEIAMDASVEELSDRLNGPVVYARLCHGRQLSDAAIEGLVDDTLTTFARVDPTFPSS